MYPAADANAPVTLWLNGGPGASSTFANFLMNGPMRITRTGTGVDDFLVSTTDQTWSSLTHIIFIDQPVGTGFSWGEPLLTNMQESSWEFVYFLQQLFTMYPEFVGHDLYFTGESYGGKYLPAYSYAMLMHNTSVGSTYFNLKATLCGDPYTAPVTQRTHMHLVPEALNILDDGNMPQIAALEQRCRENLTNESWTVEQKGDTCASIMGYITGVSGDAYPYDSRIFGYDWDPIEQPTIDYFTISGQVQNIYKLIHVDDSTKVPVFEMGSAAVGEAFSGDQLIDYQSYI
jgi:vitellogenic carboxypeptidase-like protein